MSRAMQSLPASYFDALYAADPDPWKFRSSPYEAAKYEATLAALPRPHYGSVLEIGCSIGVLTRMLAPRCGRLLALDGSARALASARRHCAGLTQVDFAQREIPRQWPRGQHDLILFSEVLYYLDEEDLARTAALTLRALRPAGEVLLVHWTGTTDYPLSGDAAVEGFMAATGQALAVMEQSRRERYRMDLLRLA
ncbi:class I SAM-dependent DNA methyltransferase [Pseudoroseomonas ludipueritiae]|uniref:Methyltransferase domain-containing protein n=1 Tax=Pseudoroseomonas ludipueritiae TaxID=198093 RepID=A0ABR7R7S0_9PROT|nr:SAM-dependent methyltransferase [Pseudoroseomonas ludipueritiae]MBC9177718.1 methyltransferase domain-containing protein [Pseudoroseomonas ludipueritiae]